MEILLFHFSFFFSKIFTLHYFEFLVRMNAKVISSLAILCLCFKSIILKFSWKIFSIVLAYATEWNGFILFNWWINLIDFFAFFTFLIFLFLLSFLNFIFRISGRLCGLISDFRFICLFFTLRRVAAIIAFFLFLFCCLMGSFNSWEFIFSCLWFWLLIAIVAVATVTRFRFCFLLWLFLLLWFCLCNNFS